jgi:hypothetical protein
LPRLRRSLFGARSKGAASGRKNDDRQEQASFDRTNSRCAVRSQDGRDIRPQEVRGSSICSSPEDESEHRRVVSSHEDEGEHRRFVSAQEDASEHRHVVSAQENDGDRPSWENDRGQGADERQRHACAKGFG